MPAGELIAPPPPRHQRPIVTTQEQIPGTTFAIADLPASRWGAASAFYNGNAACWLADMSEAVLRPIFLPTAISWDPGTNTWSTLPNMLGERARMTGAILNGCFHVVGGRSIASSAFVGTNDNQKLCCALGTPTPSPTPCPLCTPTPSPTVSPSPTPTPTPTPTPSPTGTPCAMSTTLLSQDFESGLGAWTIDNATTGSACPTAVDWTVRPNPYDPSAAGCGGSSGQTPLNSGGGTSFAMSDSDAGASGVVADARLNSPSFSTVGMTTLRLSYRHFYRALGTSVGAVEVSISGAGGPWINGKDCTATDQGAAAAFVADAVVLDAFVGNADTRIRFRYTAGWDWWWAIDDVVVTTCSGATPYAVANANDS